MKYKMKDLCGCKGVRWCELCKNSERVKSLKGEPEFDFEGKEAWVYCSVCKGCSVIPSKSYVDPNELFSHVQSCSHSTETGHSVDIAVKSGVLLIQDFLSEVEETELVKRIDEHEWALSQSGRRKQDYGPKVNFKKQKVKLENFAGMPDYSESILNKMTAREPLILSDYQPLELCNLEYEHSKGSCIEFHVDDTWIWGQRLISINLLSGAVMTLWNEKLNAVVYVPMPRRLIDPGRFQLNDDTSSFLGCCRLLFVYPWLKRWTLSGRSLLCMYADIRYSWKHSVLKQHVRGRRIALTMREPEKKFLPGGDLFDTVGQDMLTCAKNIIPTS